MDNSFEQCVKKPDYTADRKKFRLYQVFMIISVIGAAVGLLLIFIKAYYIGIADMIIWAGAAFVFYRLRDAAIIEYDYEFSDGSIMIARISNSAKRKELVKMTLDQINAIAPLNQGDAERYTADGGRALINCAINRESRLYYIDGALKGRKVLIVWEPKQELLKLIRSERAQLVTL